DPAARARAPIPPPLSLPDRKRPMYINARFAWARVSRPLLTATVAVAALLAGAATRAGAQSGPISIWPATAVPANVSDTDTNAVELGVKFRSDVNGFITALRFYKGPSNTGTHTGNLWTSSGTLLERVTFTNETASGWQQMTLPTPAAITANTIYVASYFAPAGRYSTTQNYFTSAGVDNPPLHALANTESVNALYPHPPPTPFPPPPPLPPPLHQLLVRRRLPDPLPRPHAPPGDGGGPRQRGHRRGGHRQRDGDVQRGDGSHQPHQRHLPAPESERHSGAGHGDVQRGHGG